MLQAWFSIHQTLITVKIVPLKVSPSTLTTRQTIYHSGCMVNIHYSTKGSYTLAEHNRSGQIKYCVVFYGFIFLQDSYIIWCRRQICTYNDSGVKYIVFSVHGFICLEIDNNKYSPVTLCNKNENLFPLFGIYCWVVRAAF